MNVLVLFHLICLENTTDSLFSYLYNSISCIILYLLSLFYCYYFSFDYPRFFPPLRLFPFQPTVKVSFLPPFFFLKIFVGTLVRYSFVLFMGIMGLFMGIMNHRVYLD
uniref:NADH dehydrogenase subunit 6 n=1 Tax=Cacopsylla melanoneura TaxID=428564 RepID=A0A8D8M2R9_9HEMI